MSCRARAESTPPVTAPGAAPRWTASATATTTAGSNCDPAQRASSVTALPRAQRRAVGPRRGHRVVGVADGDDARRQGYRLARDAVGVTGAVPALVRGADDVADPAQRRGGGEDALADERVLADECPFVLGERARLAQDLVGHGDLADVVELRRALELRRDRTSVRPRPRPTATASAATPRVCPISAGSRSCSAWSSTSCGRSRRERFWYLCA